MPDEVDLVAGAQEIFGDRLRGLFLFGSRVAGRSRENSDLDVGVWLEPPLRRRTTWLPWFARFGHLDPLLDPTFFTIASLERPAGWLLEAVHGGTRVLHDPSGELRRKLDSLDEALKAGRHRRRLFMGLPYYEAADS
jgi:hypothetical protein